MRHGGGACRTSPWCAATRWPTGCPAARSAPWAPSPSVPRRPSCATCSTMPVAGSAAPIWSSSGRWRASGLPCPPAPCSPRHGRPGGPLHVVGAAPGRFVPAGAVGRRRRAPRDASGACAPPGPHGGRLRLVRARPMEVAFPARMEEAWSVPDVYLLTEGKNGEVAVPDLTLTFLDSGLALDKADGEPVWDSAWAGLEEMAPVERSVLPDGREGVVIVVVERGRGAGTASCWRPRTSTRWRLHQGRAAAHGLRTTAARPAVSACADGPDRAGRAGHDDRVAALGSARHPLLSVGTTLRRARRSSARRARARRSGSRRTAGSAPRGATTGAGGCPPD